MMVAFRDTLRALKNSLYSCNCFSSHPKSLSLEPVLEATATSPPWPPQQILNARIAYMTQIRSRPPRAIKGTDLDSPLNCLYRIYERLILDDTIGYRNEIEYFWHHTGWPVSEIPDPSDSNPDRYAFLAATPDLLVRAFNRKIEMGLARYTPAIISPEEAEALRNTPDDEKRYESVPLWISHVSPAKESIVVPMVQGPDLVMPTEKELDLGFSRLNIQIGVPCIHFTEPLLLNCTSRMDSYHHPVFVVHAPILATDKGKVGNIYLEAIPLTPGLDIYYTLRTPSISKHTLAQVCRCVRCVVWSSLCILLSSSVLGDAMRLRRESIRPRGRNNLQTRPSEHDFVLLKCLFRKLAMLWGRHPHLRLVVEPFDSEWLSTLIFRKMSSFA